MIDTLTLDRALLMTNEHIGEETAKLPFYC